MQRHPRANLYPQNNKIENASLYVTVVLLTCREIAARSYYP